MDERTDKKYTNILEGMFCGLTEQIKRSQDTLQKEFRYGASQQGFSYDALLAEIKESCEKLLTEIKYLSRQNLDIYDYMRKEHAAMQESLLASIEEKQQAFLKAQAAQNEALLKALDAQLARQPLTEEDLKAEPVLETGEPLPPVEAESAELTAEEAESTEALEEVAAADAADAAEKEAETPEVHFDDSSFDYELLAQKISMIVPEPDYDLIADKVAALLPHVEADAVAEQVSLLLQGETENVASHVAEHIPLTDYDLIAEKVTAALEGRVVLGEEAAEAIARRVAELLKGEEGDLEELARETGVTPLEELAAAQASSAAEEPVPEEPAAEAPAPAPAEVPAPVYAQPVYQPQAVPMPVVIPVPVPMPAAQPVQPAPVVVPVPEDDSKTVRYKRSFVAKIIGSEEEVKGYYSDLKNAILSYGRVRSQINWTNDRFSIGNDSVIKIGMRGRTLVMYLALDPKEFPETVYHQKFAGDTKMYESTPMMVKIKTKAAVKKTLRLVDLCMERYGAVKEEREPVDYAAQYFFRTDEELLAEGLIKTAIVDKSDLDF